MPGTSGRLQSEPWEVESRVLNTGWDLDRVALGPVIQLFQEDRSTLDVLQGIFDRA
jgi:hypothetical protein